MPIGNGSNVGIAAKGRPLAKMAHLKSSIVEVKAEKTGPGQCDSNYQFN
jgi:hypothetical protein